MDLMKLILDEFESWCQRHGPRVAAHTARRYKADALYFAKHFGHPAYASKDTLREWFVAVNDGAPSTTNRKIAAIRALFLFALDKEMRTDNPTDAIKMVRVPKRLPRPALHSDILHVIAHIRKGIFEGSFWEYQDLAIVEVLYGSGLRREEAGNLRLRNITSRTTLTVIGKGNKERVTILTDAAFRATADWTVLRTADRATFLALTEHEVDARFFEMQKTSPEAPVFITSSGKPTYSMSDPGHFIWQEVVARAGEAGVKLTPHILRHSFGTELYNNGVGLDSIADVMGHEDIGTTKGYAQLGRKGLNAIRAAHTRQSDEVVLLNQREA